MPGRICYAEGLRKAGEGHAPQSISVFTVREQRRVQLCPARLFITWTLFFLVLFSLVTVWWADRQLRAPLHRWAELHVRNIGQRAITEAVQDVLSQDPELARLSSCGNCPRRPTARLLGSTIGAT